MTLEEFAVVQQDGARLALSHLLHDCIRRFLAAADLVVIDGPIVARIREAKCDAELDLTPLLPVWQVVCRRYRCERFDPNPSLFKEHQEEKLKRWGEFVHRELFPLLLRENEFVRNVLRAAGLLPCRSRDQAALALCQHLEEMSLPFSRPPWDPAEVE